jgi:hypothetical protein
VFTRRKTQSDERVSSDEVFDHVDERIKDDDVKFNINYHATSQKKTLSKMSSFIMLEY